MYRLVLIIIFLYLDTVVCSNFSILIVPVHVIIMKMISVLVCSIDLAPSEGRNIFVSGVSNIIQSSNFFIYC